MDSKRLKVESSICVREVVPNDILFHEVPCETVPMFFSELCCQLCNICLRPLQTLHTRINRVLKLQTHKNTTCLTRREKKKIQQFEITVLNAFSNKIKKVHIYKCQTCHTQVCSRNCWKSMQSKSWHRVVCQSFSTALPDNALTSISSIINLWNHYVNYSQKTYEGFLLVARLLCRVADSYETHGLQKAFLTKSLLITLNQKKDIYYWAFLREGKKAYHRMNPKTVSAKDIEETYQKSLENFSLLEEFFNQRAYFMHKTFEDFTPFQFHYVNIDFSFYTRLLVQLELVNVQAILEDPNYDAFSQFISSTTLPFDSLIHYQKIFQKATKILDPTENVTTLSFPELLTLFFREIHGYSYCPIIGLMNHSCSPNVSLDVYRNDTKQSTRILQWSSNELTIGISTYPLLCKIVLMENLRAGDELLLSYIDETQPLVSRCRQLKVEYGFVCRCTKCIYQAKQFYYENKHKTE
ncbi:uncharacterized protein LOC128882988 isoform X4 [Hylaeus volcanicus]|uniref:uncharacterized protein LOC128882988 isoform X4 n=1 Tax=Hylaeus volcanicus TaxID=313075 RepID=UPI0023B79553|nr:uncharacterized protein LOC128882988 isoform X4 [Hylaeus volcanicus]